MEPEQVDEILFEVVKEFTKKENFDRILKEQVLANAIFYSFAVGALNNDEDEYDTIESLQNAIQWIEDREHLLKGFNVNGDNNE
ncbi:MAG: hypothetical protein J6A15_00970 [Clostridia bacterium]|nr:hypothetical protein [Clostridia bacterium]